MKLPVLIVDVMLRIKELKRRNPKGGCCQDLVKLMAVISVKFTRIKFSCV